MQFAICIFERMFLLKICMLSLFISKCHSVGPDYYMDNVHMKNMDANTDTVPDIGKNRGNSQNILVDSIPVNRTKDSKSDSDESEFDENDLKVFVARRKVSLSTAVTRLDTTEEPVSNQRNQTALANEIMPNTTAISTDNIFKEYEYIYDDDTSTRAVEHLQLRHDTISEHNSLVTETSMVLENDKTTRSYNSSKKYYADFFNLEPAAGKIDIEEHVTSKDEKNSSVWYVPEKYPCWNLPILYAKLGQRRNTSNVFLFYAGKLKNVIDDEEEDIPVTKTVDVPHAQSLNKWCRVGPCYGDHTLCVFADKTLSTICEKGYKVSPPTMVEQIALVNTVNSMRNRLANGVADRYSHLPTAANMKQMIYDFDLENMALVWLRQCLPGPAPCGALEGNYVAQMECTKYADHCCVVSYKRNTASKCIPQPECFVLPIIGCIHEWFWSAGKGISEIDIKCGHFAPSTFNTMQLIWAETYKIGCAYGERANGDIRVICNFAPGAPFYIDTKYYCGLIAHKDVTDKFDGKGDIVDSNFLEALGIQLNIFGTTDNGTNVQASNRRIDNILRSLPADNFKEIYKPGWVRQKLDDYTNGTKGIIARLVTRYTFYQENGARCDREEPAYVIGEPGSLCVERGRRFDGLCYDFRDPTPGYRLIAVIAPAALFSLILFDLFSGVLRQTNY